MQQTVQGKRDGFTSALGALAATLASAIGLGNIWKFPYLTGENGGAAFLVVYIGCVALLGIPVMVSEFIIGRSARANAVGAWRKLAPKRFWRVAGWMGVASAFLIMSFYTGVAGWVLSYVARSATGRFSGKSSEEVAAIFDALVKNPYETLAWQAVVLAGVGAIMIAGVSKGIERITKCLLPVLFALLLACCLRSLSLKGASEGLAFLFRPDFGKLTAASVLTALGLAFFKLSVGIGTMTTYGSYLGNGDNLGGIAIKVSLADTLVSVLAGIAIFPAVFAFGFVPSAGPSLLFITMPKVFESIPMGGFFLFTFFLLTSIATVGAMVSIAEVPVAILAEELGLGRRAATLLALGGIALLGVPATLSTSLLADVTVFGKTFFDLFDFLSSNVLLPLGGLLICLFVGWSLPVERVARELGNEGKIRLAGFLRLYLILVRFVCPLGIAIVFLRSLGILK